jgi:integrase/recombinase XerD
LCKPYKKKPQKTRKYTMSPLALFTQYLREIGYSKSSQYQIPQCIQEFLEVTKVPLSEVSQAELLCFYEYLQTRPLKRRTGGLSEAMIYHYVYSLKTFFSWLEETHQITHNPMSNLKFKRPTKQTREPLSQAEIGQLFSHVKTTKERVILHLFYSCGLRRTEAEMLNTSDVHFSRNLLYVREGKGAKRRVVPMNESVKHALETYYHQERLPLHATSPDEAFVLNQYRERMRGNSYQRALQRILQRSELPKEITLHHLRHSIATHLLENGLSIESVRDFLGHRHLESTQIYVQVRSTQLKALTHDID